MGAANNKSSDDGEERNMSYAEAYQQARLEADDFWADQARAVAWYQTPTRILETLQDGTHRWFGDGVPNTSYLALDYQIEQGRGEQLAPTYDSPAPYTLLSSPTIYSLFASHVAALF